MSSVWVLYLCSHHVNSDTGRIGERYGALTLIILYVHYLSRRGLELTRKRGEGFIALIRGLSSAISGLSVGSTATVGLVFCTE